jgi:hypothetical protein
VGSMFASLSLQPSKSNQAEIEFPSSASCLPFFLLREKPGLAARGFNFITAHGLFFLRNLISANKLSALPGLVLSSLFSLFPFCTAHIRTWAGGPKSIISRRRRIKIKANLPGLILT